MIPKHRKRKVWQLDRVRPALGRGGGLPQLPPAMLHQVDVEVNGVAEHSQQVGQLAGMVQPSRPGNLGIVYTGQ
jgi:hypothetical protein